MGIMAWVLPNILKNIRDVEECSVDKSTMINAYYSQGDGVFSKDYYSVLEKVFN